MNNGALTPHQVSDYKLDGYVIVKDFFKEAEVEKLYDTAIHDTTVSKHAINVNDSTGKSSKLSLWYKSGNDLYGLLTRSERMVYSADQLLDGDSNVCHYRSKLMQKETKVGGAWSGIRTMVTGIKTNFCFQGNYYPLWWQLPMPIKKTDACR